VAEKGGVLVEWRGRETLLLERFVYIHANSNQSFNPSWGANESMLVKSCFFGITQLLTSFT